MPRKRRRFNRLFRELKGVGSGNPEDGRTGEFLKFLRGQNKIVQQNKISPEARELFKIALYPFALTPTGATPDQRYEANISAYSLNGLSTRATGISEDKLGINRIVGGERNDSGFFPALMKATFDSSTSTVNENKISGITKEPYRYKYGRTFSFPFGRTTNVTDAGDGSNETVLKDVDELDVYRFCLNDITVPTAAANIPRSVSYEAEVFKTQSNGKALETNTTVPSITVN